MVHALMSSNEKKKSDLTHTKNIYINIFIITLFYYIYKHKNSKTKTKKIKMTKWRKKNEKIFKNTKLITKEWENPSKFKMMGTWKLFMHFILTDLNFIPLHKQQSSLKFAIFYWKSKNIKMNKF